jgi:hypothetical protein
MIEPSRSPKTLAALGILSAWSALAADTTPPLPTTPPESPWTSSASLTVKEGYDDNVYLQNIGPNANHGSSITVVNPNFGLAYQGSPKFGLALTYAPEFNYFDAASGEDFTTHRVGLTGGGQMGNTGWEVTESFVGIDGSDIGPTYLQTGGAPANGGPAIRDRRAALIERGRLRMKQSFGNWFIRPVLNGYLHDFLEQHETTAGYQNFVNRSDINGGADVGWAAIPNTAFVAGYRYGVQSQDQLFPSINATYYDNHYHRLLFGVEGNPWSWLKLNLSLGPEFRHYDGIVAAGFDRTQTYCYIDSSATITATKRDTLTLLAISFEQPGFSGRSAYLDTTLDLTWRHKLSDEWSIEAGARGWNNDFVNPSADRDDWIVTGKGAVTYTYNKKLSTELAYLYDNATSEVANTPAREYTRQCVMLSLKYVFR